MKRTLKTYKLFFLTLIMSLLFGCNNPKYSDAKIEKQAERIAEQLSEKDVNIFENWRFEYRGKGEIWRKIKNNRVDFRAYYFKENDSASFMIFPKHLKSTEYPILVDIDTSKIKSNIWITKLNNGQIKVSPSFMIQDDSIKREEYKETELYGNKNPFNDLKRLSDLIDKFGIVSVRHNEYVGGYIEFYLTYEDVLTFVPNNPSVNSIYKNVWKDNLESGIMINKNWNLRKLDQPIQPIQR
ncbi:hypothetical protein [Lacinutrix algicola]|uniref:hypothetical protein n=1 Tax=Lacinutrix algicola TaxID=342954 RepID=UPI00128F8FB9|nr:hypothetical protein [Lacinutrix algicola]